MQKRAMVLYHEPQIAYALDPVIAPVKTNIKTKIVHEPIPVALAAYVDRLDNGSLAKSSKPAGVVFTGKYNGKIDSPRICSRALSRAEIETMKLGAQPGLTERRNSGPTCPLSEAIVAAWNFSDGINTVVAKDHGPYRFDAQLVNCPTRALTGYNWSGQNFDWKHAPQEYGAIHFHDDDVDDARWEVDFEWTVPLDFKSRFYAMKLTTAEGDEDYIPFWVVPKIGKEQSKIAVMVPTISYMAYANEHVACNAGGAELFIYRVPIMQLDARAGARLVGRESTAGALWLSDHAAGRHHLPGVRSGHAHADAIDFLAACHVDAVGPPGYLDSDRLHADRRR